MTHKHNNRTIAPVLCQRTAACPHLYIKLVCVQTYFALTRAAKYCTLVPGRMAPLLMITLQALSMTIALEPAAFSVVFVSQYHQRTADRRVRG